MPDRPYLFGRSITDDIVEASGFGRFFEHYSDPSGPPEALLVATANGRRWLVEKLQGVNFGSRVPHRPVAVNGDLVLAGDRFGGWSLHQIE